MAPSATAKDVCRVAVLGASGYTGAEVMRLSALHPNLKITALTGDRQAGKVRTKGYSTNQRTAARNARCCSCTRGCKHIVSASQVPMHPAL